MADYKISRGGAALSFPRHHLSRILLFPVSHSTPQPFYDAISPIVHALDPCSCYPCSGGTCLADPADPCRVGCERQYFWVGLCFLVGSWIYLQQRRRSLCVSHIIFRNLSHCPELILTFGNESRNGHKGSGSDGNSPHHQLVSIIK